MWDSSEQNVVARGGKHVDRLSVGAVVDSQIERLPPN